MEKTRELCELMDWEYECLGNSFRMSHNDPWRSCRIMTDTAFQVMYLLPAMADCGWLLRMNWERSYVDMYFIERTENGQFSSSHVAYDHLSLGAGLVHAAVLALKSPYS